jgi:hypothetical protein
MVYDAHSTYRLNNRVTAAAQNPVAAGVLSACADEWSPFSLCHGLTALRLSHSTQ